MMTRNVCNFGCALLVTLAVLAASTGCDSEFGQQSTSDTGKDQIEAIPVGEEGGACYGNDTCNPGLACNDGTCNVCEGDIDCQCYRNGTCNSPLVCNDGGTCQQPNFGTTGCQGCPCNGDGTCNDGMYCGDATTCEAEGPVDDGALIVGTYGTLGGSGTKCPKVTAPMSVPWVCQKMTYISSWDNAMCCGPACVTMIKGFVDNKTTLGDGDLQATVDWMASNLNGWKLNNYRCSGTSEEQVANTIMNYVGIPAEAKSIAWCDLLDQLDGNHIVIFHGDTQPDGGLVFKSGKSHWLILERTDADYAYINDPGRTASSQGAHHKFTVASVQSRYEARGSLAVIATVGGVGSCPNTPRGTITAPSDGDTLCGQSGPVNVIGTARDDDGIVRISIEIDGNKSCLFSKDISGKPTEYAFSIPAYLAGPTCNLTEGTHSMALWVKDACDKASSVSTIGFEYRCDQCSPASACCVNGRPVSYGTSCGVCKKCDSAGKCSLNVTDGTLCASGKTCSNGSCVTTDLCSGINCSACQKCSGGSCVADSSQNGDYCASGKTCSNGSCVTSDLCSGINCSACQKCSGGSCVADSSQNGDYCASGKTCSNGSCITSDPCAGVSCSVCKKCSGGSCVNDSAQNGDYCASGKTCSNGSCVTTDPCAGVTCSVCKKCSGGSCVTDSSQNGDYCASGKTCSNGSCVTTDPCAGVTCSVCKKCSGGSCVNDSAQNGDYCASGKTCSNGSCVQSGCPSGNGYYCENDGMRLDYCSGGSYSFSAYCLAGCHVAAAGTDDYCNSGSCPSGTGDYCGSQFGLTSNILFACSAGKLTIKSSCTNGCKEAPAGQNDYCL